MKNKEYIKTDVVIVGSGVAGLFAALCLPKDKDVLIITKENTNECDSMLAQGGVCVLKDVNDFKCYFEDTMKAGHWENDPDSVKVMIESSQEVIGTLIDLGVKFDTDKNGEYDYTREGAHRRNRILHHKDETGKEITATLLDIAKQKENITIVPRTTMIDFIEKDNVCQGIVCEDEYGEMGSIIARDIILATGGIGGVHRGAEKTMDISADLDELQQTSVLVVCAGAKSILDIGLTLECLETRGVAVVGYKTEDMPAFYTQKSGFKVDYRLDTPEEIAQAFFAKCQLGLQGGMLVTNPIPDEYSMDYDYISQNISSALQEAEKLGIHGKQCTPYLLDKIQKLTGGQSLDANIQLVYNNVRLGAEIAKCLCALKSNGIKKSTN